MPEVRCVHPTGSAGAKLILTDEHRINCPYCGTSLIYHLTAATIQFAERNRLKCGKRFVIENNIAKRLLSKKRPTKSLARTLSTRFAL